MQENRSFDHYFGCLKGVRGFGDPRVLTLRSGRSVFHQPVGPGITETVLPFRLNSATTSAECMGSLDHTWRGPINLWKHHDVWNPVKTPLTMGYFTREDIPFYYALADSFTVCDAYHASIFGPTDPNRLYLFTGTSGSSVGDFRAQTVHNADDGNWTADAKRDDPNFRGYTWTTYAERLQDSGISWKVYQEYDNFGDNSLAYFARFRGLNPNSALYRRGRSWVAGSTLENAPYSRGEHVIKSFAQDVADDALPQVSWLVAPKSASEHPDASPTVGESFTAGILAALASNPTVWAKTAFILNYDENDGFFDHVPPPVPAIRPALGASTVSTAGEVLQEDAQPLGLGPRVPAIVVSPWTRGGWVNSQLFDHTSVIRLLEARFGVHEPNISPWRRAVTGDLTSVFDFATPDEEWVKLPSATRLLSRLNAACKLPGPRLPSTPAYPIPERGVRPSRPLPYDLSVDCVVAARVTLTFHNRGAAGACFRVVASGATAPGPWFFTVEAGKSLTGTIPRPGSQDAPYDIVIFGPNGFFRHVRGVGRSLLDVEAHFDSKAAQVVLTLTNSGPSTLEAEVVTNTYGLAAPRRYALPSGGRRQDRRPINASAYWYDVSVKRVGEPQYLRRFAGHMETGAPGISDPAIGSDITLV
jgi:phospholipase C